MERGDAVLGSASFSPSFTIRCWATNERMEPEVTHTSVKFMAKGGIVQPIICGLSRPHLISQDGFGGLGKLASSAPSHSICSSFWGVWWMCVCGGGGTAETM